MMYMYQNYPLALKNTLNFHILKYNMQSCISLVYPAYTLYSVNSI